MSGLKPRALAVIFKYTDMSFDAVLLSFLDFTHGIGKIAIVTVTSTHALLLNNRILFSNTNIFRLFSSKA